MEDHGRKLSCRAENPMLPNSVKTDEKILEIFCKFIIKKLILSWCCFWVFFWFVMAQLSTLHYKRHRTFVIGQSGFDFTWGIGFQSFPNLLPDSIYCQLIDSSSVRRMDSGFDLQVDQGIVNCCTNIANKTWNPSLGLKILGSKWY